MRCKVKKAQRWVDALLLWLIFASAGGSEQELLTNLDLVSLAVEEVVDEGMRHLGLGAGQKIFLVRSEKENNLSRFVVNCFCEGLMKREMTVFSKAGPVEEGVILFLVVSKAAVRYKGISRKGFLGRGWILRDAEVALSLRAVNGQSQKLVWVGELVGSKSDQVPVSELDFIEQGGLVLGRPHRPEDRGVRKWIEPLLAVGTVGLVAYLFYMVRSR